MFRFGRQERLYCMYNVTTDMTKYLCNQKIKIQRNKSKEMKKKICNLKNRNEIKYYKNYSKITMSEYSGLTNQL